MIRLRPVLLPVVLVLFLGACQSSEEQAEEYFQSALTLLAEGDEDRAMLEFRNVFKFNGFHKEGRKAFADLLVKRGDISGAYGQYLRLIEQYPDTVEVRQTLAELAMGNGNWDEVERHGRAALALSPDLPGVKAIGIALDYRAAVQQRNSGARDKLAAQARDLIAELPENLVLRRILIDNGLSSPDPQTALVDIEAAIALAPNNLDFNTAKLRLLALKEDIVGVGEQLKVMVARFPEAVNFKTALIQWYLGQNDLDGAEAFLRAQAGAIDGPVDGHLGVVQMLNQTRSRDAGREELARLIAANAGTANSDVYAAFLATMDFEDGNSDAAIAALQALVDAAAPSDQTRKLQVTLARMLNSTGKRDDAKALVETTLQADSGNVEALKLRALWYIAEDRTGDAILDLRAAQGQAPRDPQIMTLMAAAYERDGNLDLAGEQLAQAVETSDRAPAESLRYAKFLSQQGRPEVATRVLTDARRLAPGNLDILLNLAQIYTATGRWTEAGEILEVLRKIDSPQAKEAATRLQAAILLGQGRVEEGMSVLESDALDSGGDARAIAVLLQTQIRAGKLDEARSFLDKARADNPDDLDLLLMSASLDALEGKQAEAEAAYREVIAKSPKAQEPVRLLYGLLMGANRADEAEAVLDAALIEQPNSRLLLWTKAGLLEKSGDTDAAIAIYEQVYAANSGDVVAANNLASMITTYRNDPVSLDRAAVIARRLRDVPEPAFQDTYGWIEYRRGNLEEAVKYLEPAAAGLPNDPLAQFHLAMAYADLGRQTEAIALFIRMLDMTEGQSLPQIAIAQARLDALRAPQVEAPTEATTGAATEAPTVAPATPPAPGSQP